MPNWVSNKLILQNDMIEAKELIEFLASEDECVDFNKIIPMPESLNIESGSNEIKAIAVYKYLKEKDDTELKKFLDYPWVKEEKITDLNELCDVLIKGSPEILETGRIYVDNLKNYGCTTWYEWCNRYWGTKWNACHSYTNGTDTIGFDTAWSCVDRLICELSKKFPNVEIIYQWADEDFGYNVGTLVIKNGEVLKTNIPSGGTDEAMDMAAEILEYDCREDEDYEDEDDDTEE